MRTNFERELAIIRNRERRNRQLMVYKLIATLILVAAVNMIILSVNDNFIAYADEPDPEKCYSSIYVQPDMTLWQIAEEYKLDSQKTSDYVEEVVRINNLSDKNDITYGMHLIIPYYE